MNVSEYLLFMLTVALCLPQTACVSQFPNDTNVKVRVGKVTLILLCSIISKPNSCLLP